MSKDDESTVFDFLLNLIQSPGYLDPKRKLDLLNAVSVSEKPVVPASGAILTPADTENDVESTSCSPDHSDDCPPDVKDRSEETQ